MNRTDSLARWRSVAAGGLDDPENPLDLNAWIRDVARQLLELDELPSNRRAGAILGAVGLAGHKDGYADLRALVNDAIWDFSALDVGGNPIDETNGQTIRRMVEVARQQGLLTGVYEVDDKKAFDLIRGLRKSPKRL